MRATPIRHVLAPVLVLLVACGEDDGAPPAGRPASPPAAEADARAPAGDAPSDTMSADTTARGDEAPAGDAAAAADVVRRYYDAIAGERYREAWLLWSGAGTASGQSFFAFERGFAETAEVDVEIGTPGRVEGAAGSRYVEVPVVVRAVTDDGDQQRFRGSYTLRRSVVDGATAEQRAWRIHSASIRAVE